jgi:predicted metal-dependent hydrolase
MLRFPSRFLPSSLPPFLPRWSDLAVSSQHMAQRALLYRRPSEPQAIEIAFDGSVYPVRLRRHRQARRYTLRIQATTREVILTIPPRGTVKEASAFAQKHGGWIAARLGRLPQAAPFADGVLLPLRGVPHRITHRGGTRGTVWAEVAADGDEPLLCVAGRAPHIDRRIGDFLRREAKQDLQTASRRYADELGLAFQRVTVRDQSSRWGSCSTTGVLSFSWRLILAPSEVLDYLAAHEVAHLIEMNHSPKFWRLVQRICPDHERAKAWLDVHGADLHRYGLPA